MQWIGGGVEVSLDARLNATVGGLGPRLVFEFLSSSHRINNLQKTNLPPVYQARIPLWDKRAACQIEDTVNFMLFTEVLDVLVKPGLESDWTSYDAHQDRMS